MRLVDLRTTITPQLEKALNGLTLLTGRSKASIVREALALYLVSVGVAAADATLAGQPTPTNGRLAKIRKDYRKEHTN